MGDLLHFLSNFSLRDKRGGGPEDGTEETYRRMAIQENVAFQIMGDSMWKR